MYVPTGNMPFRWNDELAIEDTMGIYPKMLLWQVVEEPAVGTIAMKGKKKAEEKVAWWADGRDEGERIPKMAASKVVRFEEGSQGEEQKHVGGKRKRDPSPHPSKRTSQRAKSHVHGVKEWLKAKFGRI